MKTAFLAALKTRALGQRCEFFATLPSTQTHAAELALQGAEHGTLVYTHEQSAGRGRAGRTWLSGASSLCASVILREGIVPSEAFQWSFVAGLAVQDVISGELKWPNDVLVERRKVAGVLCTLELTPTPAVIVGIGINLGFDPTRIDPTLPAAALASADHASTLAALMLALETRAARHPVHTLADYRSKLALVGESVVVKTTSGDRRGVITGIADDFALLLRDTNGETHAITSGEVWLS